LLQLAWTAALLLPLLLLLLVAAMGQTGSAKCPSMHIQQQVPTTWPQQQQIGPSAWTWSSNWARSHLYTLTASLRVPLAQC
jgi:hypothetical protein